MENFEENGIEIDGLDEIEIENTAVDDLESENINLIFLGIDESYSMSPHRNDMSLCLGEFRSALINSEDADDILVARADFSDNVTVGGYKKITEFDTGYSVFNMTSLYKVVELGAKKLFEYYDFLKKEGHKVKAVFAIFSDGEDTMNGDFNAAKKSIDMLNKKEITTAFIAFGNGALKEAKDLGFRNILDVKTVDGADLASKLRRAFNCLSKSVIKNVNTESGANDDFFQI